MSAIEAWLSKSGISRWGLGLVPMIWKYYVSLYLIGSKGQVKFIDEFLLNREFHPFFFIFIEMKRISVFWLREGRYSSVTNLKNHKIKDETAKETLMYRIVFWTLWERERVGWFGRMALKHVQYHIWNESPVQVRCTILDAHWDDPEGWYGEGGGRRVQDGEHMYLWWIHFDIWQNQYNIVKLKNKIKKNRITFAQIIF